MDSGTHQQQPLNDLSPEFALDIPTSSHSDILSPPMARHDMSSVFPTKVDPPHNTTNGLRLSMTDIPDPEKISPMDFIDSATTVRAIAPNFIPDFPSFITRPHLDGRATSLSSPSGASSVSSNPSHVASPAMLGMLNNYGATSSSLEYALTNIASRSRSGSSPSPGNFANLNSEFGFPLVGSTSIHPTHDFLFPLPDPGTVEQKPDSSGAPVDSHIVAIGGLLTK
jgi:hypothetical protein